MKWKTIASVPVHFGLEKAKDAFKKGLYWSDFRLQETEKAGVYMVGNSKCFFPNMKLETKKGRISLKRGLS